MTAMPYVLPNDKNWLMYNATKQFTATPDVKQAQQFATEARAWKPSDGIFFDSYKPTLKNEMEAKEGGK